MPGKQTKQPSGHESGAPSEAATASNGQQAPEAKRRRVNTSNKGAAIELLAIKHLEGLGYTVHRCVRTGMRRGSRWISQSNDVFGCIDLIAKKTGERTRWIQVTADGGIGRKKDKLDAVPWDGLFDSVEIWRWVGGRSRRHKTTGELLERQYFQVYHHDDQYALDADRRIRLADTGEDGVR